ncbi:MAG: hypothetical protein G01um101470_233 [Parcubacteria group bacterium Gr01-1014_70]|nr:MAG: hypothetical protein G01um101470_233 [Parcubacteria group bacterium Gr01-1014_70]
MLSTHSLNLLPPENRKRIGYMRLSRFFLLFHSYIAFFFLIGIVLLLPTYFFLVFEHKGTSELVHTQSKTAESTEAREIEQRIEQTNIVLNRFESGFSPQPASLVRHIENIIALAPAGIQLTSLSYDKKAMRIQLQGQAAARNDLLQFISALRNQASFHNLESPVENILKGSDVSFVISFTINSE